MNLFDYFAQTKPVPPAAPANNGTTSKSAPPPRADGPLTIGLFDHGTGYKISTSLFEHVHGPLVDFSKQLSRCGCYQIEIVAQADIVRIAFGLATLDIYEISKGSPKSFWAYHLMNLFAGLTRRLPQDDIADTMTRWNKLLKSTEPPVMLMALRASRILRRYEVTELNGLDVGVHLNLDLDAEAVDKLWTAPGDIVTALSNAARDIKATYKAVRDKAATR